MSSRTDNTKWIRERAGWLEPAERRRFLRGVAVAGLGPAGL